MNRIQNVVKVHDPIVSIFIEDPRGINATPKLTIGDQPFSFLPGSDIASNKGIHASIDKNHLNNGLPFTLDLKLEKDS